jgi:hypothetical protein
VSRLTVTQQPPRADQPVGTLSGGERFRATLAALLLAERVVAYDKAGNRIAECYAATREGDVCDRPQGAPQPP